MAIASRLYAVVPRVKPCMRYGALRSLAIIKRRATQQGRGEATASQDPTISPGWILSFSHVSSDALPLMLRSETTTRRDAGYCRHRYYAQDRQG